jgi:predicted dehydrogenase
MGYREKARFALVGCGLVAPAHARSLREMPEAELAVVCDVVEERVRAFAGEFGCAWSTDYASVLARKDVDIVSVTTPPNTHLALATAAAAAGKHVVVEKPIEITVDRGRQIVTACRDRGVKLAVIFQSRWKKSVRLLKDAVDSGKLGRLLLGDAYVKWFRPQSYYESSPWRGRWDREGGAALINQSIHTIDSLLWLMGPVESVFAHYATTPVHQIEAEDLGVAALRFRNGALGVIEGSTALRPGLPERLEVHGEKGTVIIEGGAVKLWSVEGMDEAAQRLAAQEPTGTGANDPMAFPITWHKAQLQDFVAAIRQGREPAVNGEEGLRALEVVTAIYQSSRSGQPVRF